jgi:acetamidase/formamidase
MGMIKMPRPTRRSPNDAYGLASVAMDCRVSAVSDAEKNVHCLMPKSIWANSNVTAPAKAALAGS